MTHFYKMGGVAKRRDIRNDQSLESGIGAEKQEKFMG